MQPFKVKKLNKNLEVVAKIADSLVREFGCRVKYDKASDQINLVGESYCEDVVREVVSQVLKE